jgi:superfamily II DNA/RNA helicase
MLFSATMPPEITRLAKQFQNDPVRIEVSKPATAATTIKQYVTHCPSNEDTVKRAVLRTIIRTRLTDRAIVFCNRKTEVDIVAKSLQSHGFDAAPIHGDLPQPVRTATLDKFRDHQLKLLVASDVAARGLDIPEVSQVFNYAPPPNSDDYVHRIGRTGRAGRSGESFTIVSPGDSRLWDAVVRRIAKDVEPFSPEGLDEAIGEARSRGPAPGRDRFGGRGRRGGRDRDRNDRPRDQKPEERAPPPAALTPLPRDDFDAEPAQPESATARAPRREERPGRDRGRKGGGRRGRERERQPGDPQGGDEKFKGMGDHVPAFLLRTLGSREEA